MSYEVTRNTVVAAVKQTDENIPIFPTSGNDYIATQDGFELVPVVEVIENAEIQGGTIDRAASIPGLESATCSYNHYLRGSGIEGQKPNYSIFIESFFGIGSETVNSTERVTASGSTAGTASTRAVIKAASNGSDWTRGKAVLIKDSIGGFQVRNIHEVSLNDLVLAQNLASAPAAGVGLGKCINYTPKNDGQPFCFFDYRGNGGALQLAPGTMTESMTINIPATEGINVDYSFRSNKLYFNPVQITASTKYIDFNEGGTEISIALTEKTFRDVAELASEIQTKMDAAATATITCNYSNSTGSISFTTTGATLNLLWNTGTNTANSAATKLGFTTVADSTGALTYSGSALSWASPFTPTLDNTSFLVAKNNQLMVGSFSDYLCLDGSSITVEMSKEAVDVLSYCAETGKSSTIFNGRDISMSVTAYLQKNDISKWIALKNNTTQVATYNCGQKNSGNWIPGSVANIHLPTSKISEMTLADQDGIVVMNFVLTAFTESAKPAGYLNFL